MHRVLLRRIWLPERLYAAMPWIYLGNGTACLGGTLFLPDQTWLLPYGVLAGTGCLHLGVRIALSRRRASGIGSRTPMAAPVMSEFPPSQAGRGVSR